MNSLSPQPYKGTRDFYPADKRVQNYIFSVWRKISESFGYEEYGAPILEPLEVYVAKSGQELASEQTYTFTDRGDRVVAIRPEMTPSVSRMVAAKRQELAYPARLYSIANFMRYERPQKGREREFWQLNIDIFGDDSMSAEAEIISMSDAIMRQFGANPTDYVIKVNNRKLINLIMAQYLELDSAKALAMIKLFDRKNKISQQDFTDQAAEIFDGQAASGLDKVNTLLNAKTMADLPQIIRDSSVVREIQTLFTMLERGGVTNVVFDITLMRGFDYYTGMVFEVNDTDPNNSRSLFGGGRYDGLVGLFGVEPISAVGVAPGGTTMEEFLKGHNLLPVFHSTTDLYIATLGDVAKEALKLATDLRQNGINVELDMSGRKLDKQIKTVIKKDIRYMLFIGSNEVASGQYAIKDMVKSAEYRLGVDDIINLIHG